MSARHCADQVELKRTSPRSRPLQEFASNLLLIPTNVLTDSRLYNRVNNVPQSCQQCPSSDFPTNARQSSHATEGSIMHVDNIKETSSQKPQNTNDNQAIHGKDEGIHGSSEETMVDIPAIPPAMCMPVIQNLPGSSADGAYRLLAAPNEAVPISYRSAEPIRQPQRGVCALGPCADVLLELNSLGKGPNSLVHATALACGAHVVPLEEAAWLINAIESKIRSRGAIIAKLPSSNLTSPVICNKILTADNLARLGWPRQTSCTLCNGPMESGLHLCLTCPFAQEVWTRVLTWENMSLPQHAAPTHASSLKEWWEEVEALFPKSRRREFNGIAIYIMWNI